MGYTHYYLDRLDKQWRTSPKKRAYVDLFLATTVAYGNTGWLVNDWGLDSPFGIEAMTRSYYMMQQLQQQYAFVRPRKIEYAEAEGQWCTPSQALANGAIAKPRLHVEYDNGTEVFVNRCGKGDWTVKDHAGQVVKLPPSGWLVFRADNGFYESSAAVDGRRVDYVKAPAYEYVDGRGTWTTRGRLGATGSLVRRDRGDDTVELIDLHGNDRIAFASPQPGQLVAYDPEGKNLGKVDLTSPRAGWYQFTLTPGARRYVFAIPQPSPTTKSGT